MEAIGLTVSLLDLCGKLYKTIQSVKNPPEDFNKLAEELTALQSILESVKPVISGNKSSVSIEARDRNEGAFRES
jgi:hypothetical protein